MASAKEESPVAGAHGVAEQELAAKGVRLAKGAEIEIVQKKLKETFKTVQQDQDGARAMAIVRTFSIFSSFPHCCNRYNLSSGLVLFDQTGSQDLKRQTKCT